MRRFLLLSVGAALLLSACAGAPPTVSVGEGFSGLPADRDWYVYLDAEAAPTYASAIGTAILTQGDTGKASKNKDGLSERLLGATKKIALAVTLEDSSSAATQPSSFGDFVLRADGDFSIPFMGLSLFLDPAWKKIKTASGRPYWRSRDGLLAFEVLGGHTAFLSGGGNPLVALGQGGPKIPDPLEPLFVSSPLYGWTGRPDAIKEALLRGSASSLLKLPIEAVGMALTPGGDGSAALSLCVVARSESEARAFGVLLRLLIASHVLSQGIGPDGALRFQGAPELSGRAVVLRSEPMADGADVLVKILASLKANPYINE